MFKKLNQYDIDTIINKRVIVKIPISTSQEIIYVGYLLGAQLNSNNNNCEVLLLNEKSECLNLVLNYYPDIKVEEDNEFNAFDTGEFVFNINDFLNAIGHAHAGQLEGPSNFTIEYNASSFLNKTVYDKYKVELDILDLSIGLVSGVQDLTVDNVLDIINIVGIENISDELKNILTA